MLQVVCDVLPLRVVPPIVFASIVYPMCSLHADFVRFLVFTSLLVILNVTAMAMCFFVRCDAPCHIHRDSRARSTLALPSARR